MKQNDAESLRGDGTKITTQIDRVPEKLVATEIGGNLDISDIGNLHQVSRFFNDTVPFFTNTENGKKLIKHAMKRNDTEMIFSIIRRGRVTLGPIDFNKILNWASKNGHVKVVVVLLALDPSRGVDPSIYLKLG